MFENKSFRNIIILLIVIANIGCDQISKKIVRESVSPGDRIELINQNFLLMNVENNGAFLSVFSNASPLVKKITLLGLPTIMLIGVLFYLFSESKLPKVALIGWSFVIGGGIGNMYDRIKFGSVTDFLFIDLGGIFRTGVFNMADVSIMVGMGFLILFYIQDATKKEDASIENDPI
ncbi:signal peptidase II [Saprospiraceae bacterium]|jgi:signal peptidase II|nr:signal peptidase II [Saprospiraceae bacterium]MDB4769055.1 signal peptidase II [Saprospiraceae bacterium]MDC3219579.1 signal peptidase II [Saprospiraceae bacterium]